MFLCSSVKSACTSVKRRRERVKRWLMPFKVNAWACLLQGCFVNLLACLIVNALILIGQSLFCKFIMIFSVVQSPKIVILYGVFLYKSSWLLRCTSIREIRQFGIRNSSFCTLFYRNEGGSWHNDWFLIPNWRSTSFFSWLKLPFRTDTPVLPVLRMCVRARCHNAYIVCGARSS